MEQATRTQTLTIDGMMCDACVGHVTKAVQALPGVQDVKVDLGEKRAVVIYDPSRVDMAQIVSAVEEEGYEATPAV